MTELQKLADQSRTLKDEVDILRLVNYFMYCSVFSVKRIRIKMKRIRNTGTSNFAILLRETSDKVAKYEGIIETYKKKLEEMGDLKRQGCQFVN